MYLPVLTVHWPVLCVRPPGGGGLSQPAPRHCRVDGEPLLPGLGRPPRHRHLVQGHHGQGAPGDPGPARREGDNWGKSLFANKIVLKTSKICRIIFVWNLIMIKMNKTFFWQHKDMFSAGQWRSRSVPPEPPAGLQGGDHQLHLPGQEQAGPDQGHRPPVRPARHTDHILGRTLRQPDQAGGLGLVLVLLLSCHYNYYYFLSSCLLLLYNPTVWSSKI